MKAPIDTPDNTDMAQEQRKSRPRSAKQSCQRCKVIRLFLVAAACIGILQLTAPDTFTILQGLEPLTLSILFVGGFGIIAIVTSVAEYWATRADDSENQL
jgi:nitrate reductase NapE component